MLAGVFDFFDRYARKNIIVVYVVPPRADAEVQPVFCRKREIRNIQRPPLFLLDEGKLPVSRLWHGRRARRSIASFAPRGVSAEDKGRGLNEAAGRRAEWNPAQWSRVVLVQFIFQVKG